MVFIVFDGLNGSGKTTQAERFRDRLTEEGLTVYVKFHPSDSWAGTMSRRFLLAEGMSAHFCAAIFYIVDVLVSVIQTPWRLYDHVIYVRYLMGTAYLPPPLHAFAYRFFAVLLPEPKHTLFLRIDPREAHRRITANRREKEMFESLDQLEKIGVRALYLAMINGWTVIDANKPMEEVEEQIQAKFR